MAFEIPASRRLTLALLLSLVVHALLLCLRFGALGTGLPGAGFPWQERRLEAPDLRVVLMATKTTAAEPADASQASPASSREPPLEPAIRPPTVADLPLQSSFVIAKTPVPARVTEAIKAGFSATDLPAQAPMAQTVADAPTVEPSLAPSKIFARAAAQKPTQMTETITSKSAPSELAAKSDPAAATDGSAAIAPLPIPTATVIAVARAETTTFTLPVPPESTPAAAPAATPAAVSPSASNPESALPTMSADTAKQEAAKLDTERQKAARAESARLEAARQKIAQTEAQRQADKLEAARVDAAKVASAQMEVAKAEAAQQEAVRAESARLEAQRKEAARLEVARLTTAKMEAQRNEIARQDAARSEAARAAARDAARIETEREEGARQVTARLDATRAAEEKEEDTKRDARRQAMGRVLNEEAAQRKTLESAETGARSSPNPTATLPYSLSTARRARLWGRTDTNAELVQYAETWARKIEANTQFEMVREVAKRPHIDPMLTVAIRSDGSVESVTFVLSSGVPEVDEAIRLIVHSHASYRAFPPALAREVDVIEVRRTWHFDIGIRLY